MKGKVMFSLLQISYKYVMKLKKVGFFKELEYGDENGVSLKKIINNSPEKDEDKIINYLDSAMIIYVTAGIVCDILDESKGIIGTLEILTDGEWMWPSDLSYYIAHYHARLDKEFVDHVRKNNWTINKDKINLSDIEC